MEKINSLIKIGGSLMEKSDNFYNLIESLEDNWKRQKLVLTTGSKDISDIVRERLNEILWDNILPETKVDITWKSRDIVATAFSDLSPNFVPTNNLDDIDIILKDKKIPVIIQYEILKDVNDFHLRKWLSTDTSSAYLAFKLKVDKFIKLTDVDWVFKNIKNVNSLLKEINVKDLKKMWRTCIDITLANFLEKVRMSCYVLNWKKVNNFNNFMSWEKSIFTKVFV